VRHEFDFHARLDFGPVLFFQELRLEFFELALGRTHQVAGLAGTQEIQIVFADHPPIHHPDAFGLAIFFLHQLHHPFHGRDVGRVARKDLVADR